MVIARAVLAALQVLEQEMLAAGAVCMQAQHHWETRREKVASRSRFRNKCVFMQ